MPNILVSTIFGAKTRQPIVVVKLHKTARERGEFQLSIAEARDLAANILQAAESGLQDAFIIDFAKSFDLDEQGQAHMLRMFREMRRDRQNDETA
jgi:hypothetical protein